MEKCDRIIVASGYFDPLHYGHVEYLKRAKALGGKLHVIVNNDKQAELKKGFHFMPCSQRIKIIRELRCVDFAIESIDEDRTVCKTIAHLHPDIFAKGGDTTADTIPERAICDKLGVEIMDDLGAKIESSRWLLKNIKENGPSTDSEYFCGK